MARLESDDFDLPPAFVNLDGCCSLNTIIQLLLSFKDLPAYLSSIMFEGDQAFKLELTSLYEKRVGGAKILSTP